MELFEKVEVVVKHDGTVLVKMEDRLTVLGVPRLDRFRKGFEFLQRMPIVNHMEG